MYAESENIFTSALYDLVEAVYYKGYSDKRLKKKTINNEYSRCNGIIDRIRNLSIPLTFKDMWQFAEFIITAEKVYFYQNVQSSGICCDKCEALDRVLFFAYDDRNLYIKITMAKTNVSDKLSIHLYREWGRKNGTTFNVEGQECNITSDSDHMLVNTINAYVQNSIADLFESYVELAYHGMIYDSVLGNTEDKKHEKV